MEALLETELELRIGEPPGGSGDLVDDLARGGKRSCLDRAKSRVADGGIITAATTRRPTGHV